MTLPKPLGGSEEARKGIVWAAAFVQRIFLGVRRCDPQG